MTSCGVATVRERGTETLQVHLDRPGMVMVCVAPCRSLKTGETAVVGEELILPLSALGERLPLTRTSQPPPPWTSEIQQQPE